MRRLSFIALLFFSQQLWGEQATVAVAANFRAVVDELIVEFERTSHHKLRPSLGSTGALYAQIQNGAPYDILLAADQARPELLEEHGLTVPGTRFTYAIGRLTLWSAYPDLIDGNGVEALAQNAINKLAIANPRVAPYGLAAEQTLKALNLWTTLESKIVLGENIGQTHAMVATKNADAGFVARSYVLASEGKVAGSRWDVPAELHAPIRQDAVLLKRGHKNTAALAFIDFLTTARAKTIIMAAGYDVDTR